jgi:hypothetical protein
MSSYEGRYATNDDLYTWGGRWGLVVSMFWGLNPECFGRVGFRPLRPVGGRPCPSFTCTLAFAIQLWKIIGKLDKNRRQTLRMVRLFLPGLLVTDRLEWPAALG